MHRGETPTRPLYLHLLKQKPYAAADVVPIQLAEAILSQLILFPR